MIKLSVEKVNAWRLSKHHLSKRLPKDDLVNAVSDVCGVQAQVMSGAEIGIWARVEGIKPRDVRDALWKHRSLVKTWAMRGTLHLLSSSELPLYVAALKTRQAYKKSGWLKSMGTNLDEIEKITTATRMVLEKRQLTREELARRVADSAKLRPAARKRMLSGWGSLLHPAAYVGNLCFGPSEGKNVTFVRPDQWIGKWDEPASGDEALQILARRFLAAYGPATHDDFAHWWGAAPAPARKVVETISSDLEQVEFGGRKPWIREEDLNSIRESVIEHRVSLVPSFDCYVMQYNPRELLAPKVHRSRIFLQLAGWISQVVLINGVASGIWKYEKKGEQLIVKVETFEKISTGDRRLIEDEIGKLGEFFDMSPQAIFRT